MSATTTKTAAQPASVASPHVEILAPAGCYPSLQAAIDSVYFGLAQLNMRARSRRSFHQQDLAEIISRCHTAGIRGMSLYTDNASANRGACTQNCRKEYKVVDPESGQELLIDNNFVMSPNDISTIDFLDQVLEAGVHTLKLEGRGRSPEYVSTVTAAYRRAVDAIQSKTYTPKRVAELNEDLKKVYNRGHSSGYYLGRQQGWSAAHGTKATRQKIQAGRVTHYYNKLGVAEISATGPIKSGQEYLIIGDTTGVVKGTLDALRLDDATTTETATNGQVFSIQVPAKVRPKDKLFLHLPANP